MWLVTGSNRGIGFQFCHRSIKADFPIIMTGRDLYENLKKKNDNIFFA